MENFLLIIAYLSPITLAGLLVYWVYTIEQRMQKIKKEMADNNQAIANAFNSLASRVPGGGQPNASTPEAA